MNSLNKWDSTKEIRRTGNLTRTFADLVPMNERVVFICVKIAISRAERNDEKKMQKLDDGSQSFWTSE